MPSNKTHSAGGKANLDTKAPTTHESTRNVDHPFSLATESRHGGGAFSENPTSSGSSPGQPASLAEYHSSLSGNKMPTPASTSSNPASLESAQIMSQSSRSERGQRGGVQAKSTRKTEASKKKSISSLEGQGGRAPTYVENLIHSGSETGGRPHGKNLTEGGFEGSGTAEGPLPEPGSENDPGRAAFRGLPAGATTSGGGSGISKGTKASAGRRGFAELGSEESA